MAKVEIGSKTYTIPELNFVSLERAWPMVEQNIRSQGVDVMGGVSAGIGIIVAGLMEDPDFDPVAFEVPLECLNDQDLIFEFSIRFLKRQLKAKQMHNVPACVEDIMKEAGLEPEEGEAPAVEENLSTETGTPSSPNLSQLGAKEVAGTA